jgi:ATP-dependent Lhr-like helicase
MAGLATNDTLEALRGVLAWGREEGQPGRKPLSSLEAELAAWRKSSSPPVGIQGRRHSLSRRRLHSAKRAVAQRVERAAVPRWPGRWSLVHRIGVWGREVSPEERLERQARQLLQCYGIVTRETLRSLEAAESGNLERGWDWGALYSQFQLMEMRGEVRRGYFVQGLPGVQFALPEAVERLREWSQAGTDPPFGGQLTAPGAGEPDLSNAGDPVLLNACDPVNIFGPATDGDEESDDETRQQDPSRFIRIPANYVVLLRGQPVLLLETGGERVTALPNLSMATLKRALKLAVEHVGPSLRRLTLSEWNGDPILDSPVAPLLEEIGFRREALVYIWEG